MRYRWLLVLVLLAFTFSINIHHTTGQDQLTVVRAEDITFFLATPEQPAKQTILISNTGDALTGILTLQFVVVQSNPLGIQPCMVIAGVDETDDKSCNVEVVPNFTLEAASVTPVEIEYDYDDVTMDFVDATLILFFRQLVPETPNLEGSTSAAQPITLTHIARVQALPELTVIDNLLTTLILVLIVFLVMVYIARRVINETANWYKKLLKDTGEFTWGSGGWVASITSLVSTIGFITLSGNSAGIKLGDSDAALYGLPLLLIGLLFGVAPIIATVIYRLSGIRRNNPQKFGITLKDGRVIGLLAGAAIIYFSLMGSILLSGSLLKLLVIRDPAVNHNFLYIITVAIAVVITVVVIINVSNEVETQVKNYGKLSVAQQWGRKAVEAFEKIPPEPIEKVQALISLAELASQVTVDPPKEPPDLKPLATPTKKKGIL